MKAVTKRRVANVYMTIGKLFDQTVSKNKKKEALVDVSKGLRWTFEEWSNEVNKLANALIESGIEKGDIISTYLFNNSEFATMYLACAKIGAIINPINFRLKEQELAFILQDAKPKILLFEKMLEPNVANIYHDFPNTSFWYIDQDTPSYAVNFYQQFQHSSTKPPYVEVSENDIYAIMYTSGTTGRPKGALHRHRSMVEQSLICVASIRLTANDRGLVVAPMFHCAELHCCFLPRIHAGATNIILHHFDPKEVLRVIEEEQITVFFGAPTMWNMILQEKHQDYDLHSLRSGLYGAAPMAPVLVKACKDILGIDLVQAYGMTEMGPAVTFLAEEDQIRKAGSAGKAGFNHEIRIVKPNEDGPSEPDDILQPGVVGEIIVKGPCMMAGYYNRPDATASTMYKGWYHSGDLGYMDEEGYLYVADRVDDMVISGGENIYPREVEDVLYEHAGVLDVAVLGEPDEKWGERVVAVVVKKDPTLTEADLEHFCKTSPKLADYKRPRNYVFVEALPRNASGKIQKFLLRQQLTQQSQA